MQQHSVAMYVGRRDNEGKTVNDSVVEWVSSYGRMVMLGVDDAALRPKCYGGGSSGRPGQRKSGARRNGRRKEA